MLDAIFGSSPSNVINTANLLVFAFGLLKLIQAFVYISVNRRELNRFIRSFNSLGPEPTKDTINEHISLEGFRKNGLTYTTVNTLFRLSRTSLEDRDKIYYLEEVLNDQRTAFPRAVPGIAVIIGFLGTVLGLLMAIDVLPAIIETQDYSSPNALQNLGDAMGTALNGMGTAFGTTLVGLVVALALTFGNIWYQSVWNRFEHKLTDFLFLQLSPAFTAPAEENIVALLTSAVTGIQESMKDIRSGNRELISTIRSLSGNVEKYNQENKLIVEQISSAIYKFVKSQEGNREVFESIREIAGQANQNFTRIQDLLDDSATDRDAYLAYLQDSRDEIKEISTLQHQHYEKSNEAFLTKQEALYGLIVNEGRLTNKAFLDELARLNDTIRENIEVETLSKIASIRELTVELAEQLKEDMQKVMTGTQEALVAQAGQADNAFSEKVSKMQEILDRFQKSILEHRSADSLETKNLIARLTALIAQHNNGSGMYQADYGDKG